MANFKLIILFLFVIKMALSMEAPTLGFNIEEPIGERMIPCCLFGSGIALVRIAEIDPKDNLHLKQVIAESEKAKKTLVVGRLRSTSEDGGENNVFYKFHPLINFFKQHGRVHPFTSLPLEKPVEFFALLGGTLKSLDTDEKILERTLKEEANKESLERKLAQFSLLAQSRTLRRVARRYERTIPTLTICGRELSSSWDGLVFGDIDGKK